MNAVGRYLGCFWCLGYTGRNVKRSALPMHAGFCLVPPLQLEQQAVEAAAEERHHAEVQHAYKELLHMEDWSGASRDRFLGVRPNTAFEQRLKQVSAT